MIYFFINILIYLVINLVIVYYFRKRINIYSFLIILFNLNISFFFIYKEINIIYFILIVILSILLYNLLNINIKNDKEVIIVKNGNINFHELINNYSYFKFVNYLKIHHLKLDEIKYFIKKGNDIIVIKNEDNLKYPVSIILNGKIQEENLFFLKKNIDWLRNELLRNNILVNEIEYAYFLKNKIYFIKN